MMTPLAEIGEPVASISDDDIEGFHSL